jgi:hypothetical protein
MADGVNKVVAVVPSSEEDVNWVYYDDGTVVLHSPLDGASILFRDLGTDTPESAQDALKRRFFRSG